MVMHIKVEEAKSDKSSCKVCLKKIEHGQIRAGVDVWMSGRIMTGWLHMKCMAECFKFDRCKGAGKCKLSGERMSKGDARLECARKYTGVSFKLKHSRAALADFLQDALGAPEQEASELFDVMLVVCRARPLCIIVQ